MGRGTVSATGSFIASSGLRFLCPPQAKKSWVRAPYREEAFSCPVFAFCLEPHIRNFRRPSPFFAPRSRARRRSTHVVVSRSPCVGSTLGLLLAGVFVVSLPGTRLAPVPPTPLSWGRSPRTRAGPRPWKSARLRALPVAPFERDARARPTHPDDWKTPPAFLARSLPFASSPIISGNFRGLRLVFGRIPLAKAHGRALLAVDGSTSTCLLFWRVVVVGRVWPPFLLYTRAPDESRPRETC